MINNKLKISGGGINCQNKLIFASNGSFIVPEGVTQIIVSGCAAGGDGLENKSGSSGNGAAGEFVIDKALTVTPKEEINVIVGRGNTVVGDYLTLIANSIKVDYECYKLGYKTGTAGTRYSQTDRICGNGYSGAFGYGGGAGGLRDAWDSGGDTVYKPGPTLGAWLGEEVSEGGLAKGSQASESGNGSNGKVYGSGAGGIGKNSSEIPGGGGAGGYGAGGGAPGLYTSRYKSDYGNPGQGAPGIVIIEW